MTLRDRPPGPRRRLWVVLGAVLVLSTTLAAPAGTPVSAATGPEAACSASPDNLAGVAGPVLLDGAATTPGDADVVSYSWSYWDPYMRQRVHLGAGPALAYTFPENNQYEIALHVRDAAGLEDTCHVMVWYAPAGDPPTLRGVPGAMPSPRDPADDHAPPTGDCYPEYTEGDLYHVRWGASGWDLGGGDVRVRIEALDPVADVLHSSETAPGESPEGELLVDYLPGPHPSVFRYVTARLHVWDEEDEHYTTTCFASLPNEAFAVGPTEDDDIRPDPTCEVAPTGGRAPLEVVFKGRAEHPLGLLAGWGVSFVDPVAPDSGLGGPVRLAYSGAVEGPFVVKHRFRKPGTFGVGFLNVDTDGDANIVICAMVTTTRELVLSWPDMPDGIEAAARPAYRETEDTMEIRAILGDSESNVLDAGVHVGFEIVSDSPNGLMDPSTYYDTLEEGGLELRCREGLAGTCITDADGSVVLEYSSPFRVPEVISDYVVRSFYDLDADGRHDDGESYDVVRVTWRPRACDAEGCGCIDVASLFRKVLVYEGEESDVSRSSFEPDEIG